VLFGARNDFPGDFGRNVFPGSIALGAIFVVLGLAAVFSDRIAESARSAVGWALVGCAALMLVTYGADGTLLGLGSRATSAAVVAALGLAVAVPAERSGPNSHGGHGGPVGHNEGSAPPDTADAIA